MSLWSWFGPIFLRPRLICEKAILHSWGQIPNWVLNWSDSDLVLHLVNLQMKVFLKHRFPFASPASCCWTIWSSSSPGTRELFGKQWGYRRRLRPACPVRPRGWRSLNSILENEKREDKTVCLATAVLDLCTCCVLSGIQCVFVWLAFPFKLLEFL